MDPVEEKAPSSSFEVVMEAKKVEVRPEDKPSIYGIKIWFIKVFFASIFMALG